MKPALDGRDLSKPALPPQAGPTVKELLDTVVRANVPSLEAAPLQCRDRP